MLKKILKYSSALFISNVFSGGLSFFATIIAAKLLTKENFGCYSHYVLIYTTISGIFIAGTQHSLIIFVNKEKENKAIIIRLLNTFSLIGICFSFSLFLIIFYIYDLENESLLALLVIIPNVYTLLAALVFRAELMALKEIKLRVSISLINSLTALILLIFIRTKYSLITADMVSLICPSMVLFYIFNRKKSGNTKVFISLFDRKLHLFWKKTFPLWIAGILFLINSQIQNITIDLMLGVNDLATITFIMNFWQLIQRPVELIQRVTLPVMARTNTPELLDKAFLRFCIIIFPLLGIFVCSIYEAIITLGNFTEYQNSTIYILIMCISLPIVSIEFIFNSLSIATGNERINKKTMQLCVLINIPTCIILVYYFKLLGAFVSIAFLNIMYGTILMVSLKNKFSEIIKKSLQELLKIYFVFIPILFYIYKFKSNFLLSTFSCVFFIIATYILNIWKINDLKKIYLAMVSVQGANPQASKSSIQ